jgi:hypothetical protein
MDAERFILLHLPIVVVGLAAATTLLGFRYHYPITLKMMSVLWLFNFLVDLAGHVTRHLEIKNHWLYNINFWIFFISLSYLYSRQIESNVIRFIIRGFYVVFIIAVVIKSVSSGIEDLQTDIVVLGGSFIIFLSAAYFRQMYKSEDNEKITRDPWFWFSFGFIINFGGTVPFLGMFNYLWKYYPEFTESYYLYFSNSFTILLNILIITGYLCRINYQKSRLYS